MPPDAITSRPTSPNGSFSEFASTPSAAAYRERSAFSSMKKSRNTTSAFVDAIAAARSRDDVPCGSARRSTVSPRPKMRSPTVSAYGLRLPRMRKRGRMPASRIVAIASMAQSQRLSTSNRGRGDDLAREMRRHRAREVEVLPVLAVVDVAGVEAADPLTPALEHEATVVPLLARRKRRVADEEVVHAVPAVKQRTGEVDH